MRSSTVFFLVTISVALGSNFVTSTDHEENVVITEEEAKIISECQNRDYRTYIRCLRRHKRHHSLPGPVRICLEECFNETNVSNVLNDCHTKCKRKVRVEENYSRTIEADSDCNNNDCNNNKPVVHNIDTTVNVNNSFGENLTALIKDLRPNIEIKNFINGAGDGTGGPGGSGGPGGAGGRNCSGSGCCSGSDGCCSGGGCYTGPNIFSFSMSMTGFKTWPMIFPPMMPVPASNPASKADCSFCGNIMFRFRCDVSCLNANETEVPHADRRSVDRSRCKSPNCIGGT